MNPTNQQIDAIAKRMHALDPRHAVGTAVTDLFGLGCWLHQQGKHEAGLKAIDSALKAINLDEQNKTLFRAVLDHLAGNERRFSAAICAHVEINDLWTE